MAVGIAVWVGVEVLVGVEVAEGTGVTVSVGTGELVGVLGLVLVGLACWVCWIAAEIVDWSSSRLVGLEPEQAPSSKRTVIRMTNFFNHPPQET